MANSEPFLMDSEILRAAWLALNGALADDNLTYAEYDMGASRLANVERHIKSRRD